MSPLVTTDPESARRGGALALLVETLRGLAALHRAFPLALVCGSVVAVEWFVARSAKAVGVDLALCLAFVFLIPGAWRGLCSPRRVDRRRDLLDLALYVLLCAGVVFALGLALPRALDVVTYVTDPSALGILTALFAVGGWGLGRDIELEAGIELERTRSSRSALEAEHAQLLALRAQLDPHFLFNTLNAIAEWCREDPVVAEEATLRLAGILRTILEGIREPEWSLDKEIELLRALFQMYEVRDDERYRLTVDAPEPLPEVSVPAMILLPVFENAITHGPAAGRDGVVKLAVAIEGDSLVVVLRNPGAFTGRREGGQGIATVERRLALSYGDDASLEIRAEAGETETRVVIPLLGGRVD